MLNLTQIGGFGSGLGGNVAPPNDPIAWYRAEDLSGETISAWANRGSGGSGYDLTASSAISLTVGAGGFNALNFTSDTYLTTSSVQNLYPSTVVFGAVVRPTIDSHVRIFGGKEAVENGMGFTARISSSVPYANYGLYEYSTDGSGLHSYNSGPSTDKFHTYIVVLTAANSATVYIDGSTYSTTAFSGTNFTWKYIGRHFANYFGNLYSRGKYMEAVVYDSSNPPSVSDLHAYFHSKFMLHL